MSVVQKGTYLQGGPKTGLFLQVCNSCNMTTYKGDPHIKLFHSLSGVRLVFLCHHFKIFFAQVEGNDTTIKLTIPIFVCVKTGQVIPVFIQQKQNLCI